MITKNRKLKYEGEGSYSMIPKGKTKESERVFNYSSLDVCNLLAIDIQELRDYFNYTYKGVIQDFNVLSVKKPGTNENYIDRDHPRIVVGECISNDARNKSYGHDVGFGKTTVIVVSAIGNFVQGKFTIILVQDKAAQVKIEKDLENFISICNLETKPKIKVFNSNSKNSNISDQSELAEVDILIVHHYYLKSKTDSKSEMYDLFKWVVENRLSINTLVLVDEFHKIDEILSWKNDNSYGIRVLDGIPELDITKASEIFQDDANGGIKRYPIMMSEIHLGNTNSSPIWRMQDTLRYEKLEKAGIAFDMSNYIIKTNPIILGSDCRQYKKYDIKSDLNYTVNWDEEKQLEILKTIWTGKEYSKTSAINNMHSMINDSISTIYCENIINFDKAIEKQHCHHNSSIGGIYVKTFRELVLNCTCKFFSGTAENKDVELIKTISNGRKLYIDETDNEILSAESFDFLFVKDCPTNIYLTSIPSILNDEIIDRTRLIVKRKNELNSLLDSDFRKQHTFSYDGGLLMKLDDFDNYASDGSFPTRMIDISYMGHSSNTGKNFKQYDKTVIYDIFQKPIHAAGGKKENIYADSISKIRQCIGRITRGNGAKVKVVICLPQLSIIETKKFITDIPALVKSDTINVEEFDYDKKKTIGDINSFLKGEIIVQVKDPIILQFEEKRFKIEHKEPGYEYWSKIKNKVKKLEKHRPDLVLELEKIYNAVHNIIPEPIAVETIEEVQPRFTKNKKTFNPD